jgi:ABC-type lipoprotein release transport system permease subunit
MTGLNCRVLGIIPDEYRRTSQFDLINGKEEEIFNSFNSKEESCVIGSYLSEIYGIGIGDFYTINVNNQKFKFKVVGIVKSFTQDGRVIFLNKNNMEKVFGKKIFTAVFVKAKPESDIKNLKKEIREIFPDKITNILYVTEIRDSWKEDIVAEHKC